MKLFQNKHIFVKQFFLNKQPFFLVFVFFLVCVLDAYLKFLSTFFSFSYSFFSFTFTKNYYIAFSLSFLSGNTLLIVHALFLLSLFIALGIVLEKGINLSFYGICMMIIGALNNFFDRLVYGYVIDYLSIDLVANHPLIFNLSDTLIVFGFIMVCFHLLFVQQKNP